jgi:hypothetical protein
MKSMYENLLVDSHGAQRAAAVRSEEMKTIEASRLTGLRAKGALTALPSFQRGAVYVRRTHSSNHHDADS